MNYDMQVGRDILAWKLPSPLSFRLRASPEKVQNGERESGCPPSGPVRSKLHSFGDLSARPDRQVFLGVLAENTRIDNASLARFFKNLYSHVRYTDVDGIDPHGLQGFLADVKSRILEFNRRLAQNFFSYS